jgi:hypothetical protein
MIKPELEDNVTEHSSWFSPNVLEFNIIDQISVSKTIIYQNIRINHNIKYGYIHCQVFLVKEMFIVIVLIYRDVVLQFKMLTSFVTFWHFPTGNMKKCPCYFFSCLLRWKSLVEMKQSSLFVLLYSQGSILQKIFKTGMWYKNLNLFQNFVISKVKITFWFTDFLDILHCWIVCKKQHFGNCIFPFLGEYLRRCLKMWYTRKS